MSLKNNAMKMFQQIMVCSFFLLMSLLCAGQQVIPLYEGNIPNSIKTQDKEHENNLHFITNISQPAVTVYTPPTGKSNGTAVIICPGGGYMILNAKLEGSDVAQQLTSLGITAFVLKYRLPSDSIMPDKSIGPLQDAQRAIMLIITRAKEWNIDTAKIGIMGFSAGGHLASSVGTHFNHSYINNSSNINLRPAFMILIYPVISFADSLAEKNSRTALIGKNADVEQTNLFSSELQVTTETPPAFIMHAGDDRLVSVKNSIAFYLALQKNNVPVGIHIFPKGQHGFLLEPAHSNWFDYCTKWLQENGWAKPITM
jgi:acetyl esterase/lipase